jgi:hypothetical protein
MENFMFRRKRLGKLSNPFLRREKKFGNYFRHFRNGKIACYNKRKNSFVLTFAKKKPTLVIHKRLLISFSFLGNVSRKNLTKK